MRVVTLKDGPHKLEAPRIPENMRLQKLGYDIPEQFGTALNRTTDKLDDDGDPIVEVDLEALCDHLAVLLDVSEPHAGWTREKVADSLDWDTLIEAYKALRELGIEGFGEDDPKAP